MNRHVTYICSTSKKVREAWIVRVHANGSVDLRVSKPWALDYLVFNVKEGTKPGTFQKK